MEQELGLEHGVLLREREWLLGLEVNVEELVFNLELRRRCLLRLEKSLWD